MTDDYLSNRDLHYATNLDELKAVITKTVPNDVVFTHGSICASKQDASLMGYLWFQADIGEDMSIKLPNPVATSDLIDFLVKMDPLITPPTPFGSTDYQRVWQIELFSDENEGLFLNTIVKHIPAKHHLN